MKTKSIEELYKEVAFLETKLDVVESQFTDLDLLLRKCGFESGIASLKATVTSLLEESEEDSRP